MTGRAIIASMVTMSWILVIAVLWYYNLYQDCQLLHLASIFHSTCIGVLLDLSLK